MKLVKAIVRPNKLEEVREELERFVSGMTITEVRGQGHQRGHTAVYRGKEYFVSLLPKMMIDVVVTDEMVNDVIQVVLKRGKTGEAGDGRIYIIPVESVYNIRIGEKE